MQIEALSSASQDTAGADSLAVLGELQGAVDRVTEVRSFEDLWQLSGEFQAELISFLAQLGAALLVLLIFAVVYRAVRSGLRPVLERSRLEEDAADLLLAILRFVVLGFGMIVALDQLGFNVTGVLAGLGVAGLALGFAAKDTLANFISGISILWDRPFRVGDRVEIDGEFGQVKRVTLRSTRILTNRNMMVIIPNQNVVNNKIVNHTMQASLRVDVPFGIAYKADIDAAREAALATTEGDDRLRERPAPAVVLTEMGDSSVNFELRFWLKNPHLEVPIGLDYQERIKRALDAAGIEIPFPHLSLYVERLPREETPGPAGSEGAEGA